MSDERPLDDIYIDSVQLTVGAYGVAMTLGLNPPHPVPPAQTAADPLVVVRTSLEHAKILAMLLRKHLKAYEQNNGEIPIPPEVYTGLGVAKEDWGF